MLSGCSLSSCLWLVFNVVRVQSMTTDRQRGPVVTRTRRPTMVLHLTDEGEGTLRVSSVRRVSTMCMTSCLCVLFL